MNYLHLNCQYISEAPSTITLMLLIFSGSLATFSINGLYPRLLLHPFSVVEQKEYYRLLTFDFIHHDLLHLGLNLLVMWVSCIPLEQFLRTRSLHGSLEFLLIYFAAHLCGATYVTIKYHKNYDYSCVGASGSILGCLFSYMLLKPHLIAFYLPVVGGVQNTFSALIYILILIKLQFGKDSAYSHELHLFGGLGGVVMSLLLFPGILRF